jgi:glycine cleavage system transcriptional repressor
MARDFVISVMSLDRVGIVAETADAIAQMDGSIEAMSQTVVQGYFTIILTVRFERDMDVDALASAVRSRGAEGELEVSVKQRGAAAPVQVVPGAERFILTVSGRDRKGVIQRISSHLATRGVNIEDLYAYSEGSRFLLIAQLQVPPGLEVERLRLDVESLWPQDGLRVSLQHEDVFIATNDIDFRRAP